MCGIAGYLSNQDLVVKKKDLTDLMNEMKYRGPDGNGTFKIKISKKFLSFFHSRLSIIDPHKRSNQPLKDENGVIIFNGMIYNYVEIKKELISKGVKFCTNSDTEVLLKFLNIYGPEKLNLLDGMWSFAYYNFKKKNLSFHVIDLEKNPYICLKLKNL
jgi:asparagine synthase (glutamine-hydrolysing)